MRAVWYAERGISHAYFRSKQHLALRDAGERASMEWSCERRGASHDLESEAAR
jgi:hypothetical protein